MGTGAVARSPRLPPTPQFGVPPSFDGHRHCLALALPDAMTCGEALWPLGATSARHLCRQSPIGRAVRTHRDRHSGSSGRPSRFQGRPGTSRSRSETAGLPGHEALSDSPYPRRYCFSIHARRRASSSRWPAPGAAGHTSSRHHRARARRRAAYAVRDRATSTPGKPRHRTSRPRAAICRAATDTKTPPV